MDNQFNGLSEEAKESLKKLMQEEFDHTKWTMWALEFSG